MKIATNQKLWRGRNGRLWKLADRLESAAVAVRYANKPYDLVFPITNLIELSIQLREMMWEWVAEQLGLDKRDQGNWPHL